MLEFKLKKAHNGARSRWATKYPRSKIIHHGYDKEAHKASGWCKNNWFDDRYATLNINAIPLIEKYIGKNVDECYSEFLKRCHKTLLTYGSIYKEFMTYFIPRNKYVRTKFYIDDNKIIREYER